MPERTRSCRNRDVGRTDRQQLGLRRPRRGRRRSRRAARTPARSRPGRRRPPRRRRPRCAPRPTARPRGGRTCGRATRGPGPGRRAAARRRPRRSARAARAGCRRSRRAAVPAPRRTGGCPSEPASSAASSSPRPPTASIGRPAEPTIDGSSSRTASRTTTGSAVRRRAAKHNACADGGSSRWASSTSTASGPSSATRLSRLSTAAPTANRSPPEPGCEGEGRAERLGLRRRDRVEVLEDRAQQLEQPAERDLLLGVDPGGPQHTHPCVGDRGRRVLEERALADPRLAGQHERAALADARGSDQRRDDLALALAADQHVPSLGSGPGGSPDATGTRGPTRVDTDKPDTKELHHHDRDTVRPSAPSTPTS